MAEVFEGIDQEAISTSMTINATAGIILAFYTIVAEGKGSKGGEKLSGTVQKRYT